MIRAPVTKCDTGTQTDTHFMESNIVRSYEWNEWELRRKATKLVLNSKYCPSLTNPYLHVGQSPSEGNPLYANRNFTIQER
jgi:hypothetical protein